MRRVTLKGKGGRWESPLDKEEEDEFRKLLQDLSELREIRFPRCVQPLEGQFRRPLLMVFGDRSREACCTLVYLRWERDDGTACCRLVTGKTQVAPKVKVTIPRMELVTAVNSIRLAKKTREVLKIPLTETRFFTDSSAVVGMLRTESGKFNEFVGARVSMVKVNSNVEEEWQWLKGNCNHADLGMRSCCSAGYGSRIRIPDRETVDDRARKHLALQEVIQPGPGGGIQEGYARRCL